MVTLIKKTTNFSFETQGFLSLDFFDHWIPLYKVKKSLNTWILLRLLIAVIQLFGTACIKEKFQT